MTSLTHRMTDHMTYDRISTPNMITRSVVRSVNLQKIVGFSNLTLYQSLYDELDEENG